MDCRRRAHPHAPDLSPSWHRLNTVSPDPHPSTTPRAAVAALRALVWMAALALVQGLTFAAPALVTILDGEARVFHASGSANVVEALALPNAAIVQTTDASRLLRVEWVDGSALDLGPGTKVLIVAEGLSERAAKLPGVYLLRGWAKLSGAAGATAPVLMSALGELPPFKGVAVMSLFDGVQAGTPSGVFSEVGPLLWQERGGKALVTLATGQFFARAQGQASQVLPRPPATLLQALPRAFRDTLPHRLVAMQQREVKATPLPLPPYAELQAWLAASDPQLRRLLVQRFAAWSREPALKRELLTHLNDHREWGALVLPKPAASATQTNKTPGAPP